MNIGIITPGFSQNVDDWALPFLQNLADELSQHDDVRVIALRYPHTQTPYRINDVQVYPLGYGANARSLRRLQIWAHTLYKIAQLHREKPFDILHAIWADETGLLTAWAGKLLGIPTVVSIAGGELVCLPNIPYGSQCSRFGRWIVGQALQADAVTVSGSHSRAMLHQAYNLSDEKVHTLVWGVDTEKFLPQKSSPSTKKLLHVGSLVGVKNQAMLLQAIAKLENVEIDILGDGVLRPQLEQLATQLGILNRVHFVGNVAYPDMPAYFQQADLHIITSHNEVVPMATLEAAACGIPTISTSVGVLVDYPEMGMTIEKNEVALAEAIHVLLNDVAQLKKLSQSAYETVQTNFTLAKVGQQLREIYARVQR